LHEIHSVELQLAQFAGHKHDRPSADLVVIPAHVLQTGPLAQDKQLVMALQAKHVTAEAVVVFL
jgi:hypothetical protein